jgi:hypothetical protein
MLFSETGCRHVSYDGNPSAPNIRHYSVSGDHTWFLIVVFVIQAFLMSRTV